MDATTLKVAMAGLFHDIGKFADREALGLTNRYFNDNANIYLPFWEDRFSHHHALYTAGFIEQMKESLPAKLNSPTWGEGDAFINLAACHHKPQTPMQQIITEADWLTSGLDRDVFEEDARGIAYQDYKKTRMLTLFEQLMNPEKDSEKKFQWYYPLERLSSDTIFPIPKQNLEKEEAEAAYRRLYDAFVMELPRLYHRDENLDLWFEHFESLMMVCLSSVPAARAGRVVHDVSLYDHSKLTSAFASALFLYHREKEAMDIHAIKDREEQKFLLVSGNFFGIQNFIFSGYGDTRKYRSKLLRGRSFYVSLLTELAADMLCRKLGLPFTSVILNAAGRFTILAANTERTERAVNEVTQLINDWLMRIGFGEISIGIATVEASCEDFSPGSFLRLWDRLGAEMEKAKFSKLDLDRHGGVISDYLDRFESSLDRPVCPLCGKRPAFEETRRLLPSDDMNPVCSICRDHVFMGTRLVKRREIIITDKDESFRGRGDILLEPIFDRYQLVFPENLERVEFDSSRILKCWDISSASGEKIFRGISKKILSTYVPVYDDEDLTDDRIVSTGKSEATQLAMIDEIAVGEPMSLGHIAAKAINRKEDGEVAGIDALGVMKADIDYLGMLMACGLSDRRQTISRMATLSRQINYYFALYLPHLLMTDQRFKHIYTVFAGGDDLFLIGPWNRIYEFSLALDKSFKRYVCGNPKVTLSAGISLQKAHTPLSALSESVEEALEKSKSGGRNSLTMFFERASWSDAEALESIREDLELWLEEERVTKSMLYRLNSFINMAEMAKMVLQKTEISREDMDCLKWRALFSYSAARNIAKKESKDQRKQIVDQLISKMTGWLQRYGGKLRIPLWSVLYNHR